MERYFPIRKKAEPLHVKPGKSVTVTFDGTGISNAARLHFTGETAQFFQWKNEPDHPILYRRIDDSLSSAEAWKDQYCLKMESDGTYPLLAYHNQLFPPKLSYLRTKDYTDRWTLGISVKGKNVEIPEGAYLRFRAEIRYNKEGMDPKFTKQTPDEIFDLDLPAGTYDWQELTKEIVFDTWHTASVCLFLEGEGYTGTVFAERPLLLSETGWNMAPEFAPNSAEKPQFVWTGYNLSHKEWIGLDVALNGKTFWSGKIFERCHRRSEGEIPLNGATILPGENELTFTVTSDYRDALAYNLYDVAFVRENDTFLVACPGIVTAAKPFAVIVDAPKGAAFRLASDSVKAIDLTCENDGLNALLLRCDAPSNDVTFTLEYNGKAENCTVERCVCRPEDGVLTGTGDMVYVPNEADAMKTYLKWYFENQIGNFITIRPTYRWSGTRALDEDLWKKTAAFLSKAGMKYAHMMDGRELPGCDTNPSVEALSGEQFLGRQSHELDGGVSYWGFSEFTNNPQENRYRDLILRRARTHGDQMPPWNNANNVVEENGRRVLYHSPCVAADMEAASNDAVKMLAKMRSNGITRHTGPSVLFKYFYQAGYEWTGAELMYGPQEIVCAALRGASRAYGHPTVGAHHALQWSTSPHDTDEKNRRYRLALFGTWLQGVHDINTEEGLWHVEELYAGFNRFSESCKKHQKEQKDFYRYVQTHARTGLFHTSVAFLQGRYDGWDAFGKKTVWGRPDMFFDAPEKAWDTLKYFYPRNKTHGIYLHPCPNESVGYYTGTPRGNVDIIPIEQEDYSAYSLLVALGYNKATEEDFNKLQAYVEQGGTLILGRAQCAVTTKRSDVVRLNHTYLDHPFRLAIAPDGDFEADTYQGHPVTVGLVPTDATPVLFTDSGKALAHAISIEKGKVILVNVKEYAGNEGIALVYQEILDRILPEILAKEPVYAEGNEDVQFAIYDQADGGKHVYFMATDWYNDPALPRHGILTVEGNRYSVPAPLGSPIKTVVKNGVAVWCNDWENDVLNVTEASFTAQGKGDSVFTVAKDGTVQEISVDFAENAVVTVAF